MNRCIDDLIDTIGDECFEFSNQIFQHQGFRFIKVVLGEIADD